MITAIDPGTDQSAILRFNGEQHTYADIISNEALLRYPFKLGEQVAIEMVACYGMPVGREVFETCLLIGRLLQLCEDAGASPRLVYRREVKIWLCGSMKAKDGNIRQALIDKHGPPGTKKTPGKTYGISSHLWSALAIADYAINNP